MVSFVLRNCGIGSVALDETVFCGSSVNCEVTPICLDFAIGVANRVVLSAKLYCYTFTIIDRRIC